MAQNARFVGKRDQLEQSAQNAGYAAAGALERKHSGAGRIRRAGRVGRIGAGRKCAEQKNSRKQERGPSFHRGYLPIFHGYHRTNE